MRPSLPLASPSPLVAVKGGGQSRGLPNLRQAINHPEHFAPGGCRAGQDAGLSREEVAAMYGRLDDGLDALASQGAIDKKQRDQRRRAIRRAAKGCTLMKCTGCSAVWGGGSGNCPRCGADHDLTDGPDTAPNNGAMWKLQSVLYRRLFVELQADLLRTDGPALGAPAKIATPEPFEWPPDLPDFDPADYGLDDEPPPPPPPPAPTPNEPGGQRGLRLLK